MEEKFLDRGARTSMTRERMALLESIGFQWAKRKGFHAWMDKFNELREYKGHHGNCDVPTRNGPNPSLGRWVSTQRAEYRKFQQGRSKPMSLEKVDMLNQLGFRWEI